MASTRLDRANWSSLQNSTGTPDGAQKGNVYINNSTGDLWVRASGGSWELSYPSPLFELGSLDTNCLSPATQAHGLSLSSTNLIQLYTENLINIYSKGGIGDVSIGSDGGSSGNVKLEAKNSTIGDLFIACDDQGTGNISISTSGASGNISISTTGGSGDINITATGTYGDCNIEAPGGVSLGDNNYTNAQWSLAIGQYTNPWWEGSVFANNDTFGSNYTDGGGQIISAVQHAGTNNSTAQLLFPDSSIISLPESKYIYLEYKILVVGVDTSSRASFSGHIIGRRLSTTVTIDSYTVNRDSSYDDAMINDPACVAVSSDGMQINVTTTDTNPFRWTIAMWGAYTDMYIGT